MDATPLCKKHEIPGMNQIYFSVEDELKLRAHTAAERFLSHAADLPSFAMSLRQFGITAPKVLMGKIGSGDKFISDEASRNALLVDEPDLQAVDMESAAVAQVCGRHNRKCVVIRTISDSANTHAPMDFTVFIASIAAHYSHGIVSDFLKEQTQPAVGR